MGEQWPVKKWLKKTEKDKVYLADINGSEVVIKEIRHNGDVESTKKSYELIKGLNHPQIPRLLNLDIDDEKVIVQREYVKGKSLEELADWMGPIALETVMTWWLSLLKITHYIHSLKSPIIHRDIKPSNIIMGEDGYLYLIDFGIARSLESDKTSDTTLVGTMGYAAPEQFGYGQSDERTDLYNLTRTMQRLLVGVAPSHRQFNTLWDEKKKQLPKAIVKIVEKGIDFNSVARFKSSDEMEEALIHYIKQSERDKLVNYRVFAMVLLPTMVFLFMSIILNGALYSGIRTRDAKLEAAQVIPKGEVVLNLNDGEFTDVHFEELLKGYFERYQLEYSLEAAKDIQSVCIIGDHMINGDEVEQLYWDGQSVTVTTTSGESFSGQGKLSTLYDLRYLENVKTVYILNQAVGSLEGLKYNDLSKLVCQNSQLSSLRGLENMANLSYLDVAHNSIKNLKELSHLDQVVHIVANDNELSTMDGLEHNIYLESMDLSDNLMSDASVLSELRYLTALDLSGNYLTSVDVGQLKQMVVLNLSNNFLQTIVGLDDLSQLSVIDASNNELDDQTEALVQSLGKKGTR